MSQPNHEQQGKIFVGGLSPITTQDKSRGFAFVIMKNPENLIRIISPDLSHTIDDKQIECKVAVPKDKLAKQPQPKAKNLDQTSKSEEISQVGQVQMGSSDTNQEIATTFNDFQNIRQQTLQINDQKGKKGITQQNCDNNNITAKDMNIEISQTATQVLSDTHSLPISKSDLNSNQNKTFFKSQTDSTQVSSSSGSETMMQSEQKHGNKKKENQYRKVIYQVKQSTPIQQYQKELSQFPGQLSSKLDINYATDLEGKQLNQITNQNIIVKVTKQQITSEDMDLQYSPAYPDSELSNSRGSVNLKNDDQLSLSGSDKAQQNELNQHWDNSLKDERTTKIFVGGLTHDVNQVQLKEYFSTFGQVEDCVIMVDKNTQKSRGFGFLTFKSDDAVDRVMDQKDHHYMNGKWIDCKRAKPVNHHTLQRAKQEKITNQKKASQIQQTQNKTSSQHILEKYDKNDSRDSSHNSTLQYNQMEIFQNNQKENSNSSIKLSSEEEKSTSSGSQQNRSDSLEMKQKYGSSNLQGQGKNAATEQAPKIDGFENLTPEQQMQFKIIMDKLTQDFLQAQNQQKQQQQQSQFQFQGQPRMMNNIVNPPPYFYNPPFQPPMQQQQQQQFPMYQNNQQPQSMGQQQQQLNIQQQNPYQQFQQNQYQQSQQYGQPMYNQQQNFGQNGNNMYMSQQNNNYQQQNQHMNMQNMNNMGMNQYQGGNNMNFGQNNNSNYNQGNYDNMGYNQNNNMNYNQQNMNYNQNNNGMNNNFNRYPQQQQNQYQQPQQFNGYQNQQMQHSNNFSQGQQQNQNYNQQFQNAFNNLNLNSQAQQNQYDQNGNNIQGTQSVHSDSSASTQAYSPQLSSNFDDKKVLPQYQNQHDIPKCSSQNNFSYQNRSNENIQQHQLNTSGNKDPNSVPQQSFNQAFANAIVNGQNNKSQNNSRDNIPNQNQTVNNTQNSYQPLFDNLFQNFQSLLSKPKDGQNPGESQLDLQLDGSMESLMIDTSFLSQNSFFNNSHDLSQEIIAHIQNTQLNKQKKKEITQALQNQTQSLQQQQQQQSFIDHVQTLNSIVDQIVSKPQQQDMQQQNQSSQQFQFQSMLNQSNFQNSQQQQQKPQSFMSFDDYQNKQQQAISKNTSPNETFVASDGSTSKQQFGPARSNKQPVQPSRLQDRAYKPY